MFQGKDAYRIVFYTLNLSFLFLYIIPYYGNQLSLLCMQNYHCLHYYHHISIFSSSYPLLPAITYPLDRADHQWNRFQSSLFPLSLFALAYFSCRKLLYFSIKNESFLSSFRLLSSLAFLITLHSYHAVIIIVLSCMGYLLVRSTSSFSIRFRILLCWSFALFILLLKESYRIKHVFPFLAPLFDSHSFGGLYPWHLAANFLLLRILSFQLDVIHAEATKASSLSSSNLLQYLDYIFYWPLYMAGPIMTYADFNHNYTQTKVEDETLILNDGKSTQMTSFSVFSYALRWILCLLLMECLLSFFPVFAIKRSNVHFSLNAPQTSVLLYLTLKIMWLKFLLLWRFFTLIARIDGVYAPENMLRCVSNNYSLAQFWRGWHASFNQWILRYMYLPLQGRKSQQYTLWLVFLFVALWHDFDVHLVLWGLLNAFFYLLESSAGKVVKSPFFKIFFGDELSFVSFLMRIMGGGLYILILISVNMIGYAFGVDGFQHMASLLLHTSSGRWTLAASYYFLCVGVDLMKFLERKKSADSTGKVDERDQKIV